MKKFVMLPRRAFILGGVAALNGCGTRGRFAVAETQSSGAKTQTLLVATCRDADPVPIAYGSGRAESLNFVRLSVSIPPNHQAGNIEWPRGTDVDPAKHFALTSAEKLLSVEGLLKAVRDLKKSPEAETVLFVHGYNTNFAEGVYRHAQIATDYGLQGPQIHFAWSSSARALGYTYDRDSALVARDALARLLLRLLDEPRLKVSLVAHSMGAFLAMEALRQVALQEKKDRLTSLAGVTLISPDIDIDLFRAQARPLAPLPQPFVVAVAQNDRPLMISARLAGGGARLGSLEDINELEGLGILIIDMTRLGSSGGNHFLLGTSPAAISLIQGLRNSGPPPTANISLGPMRIELGLSRARSAGD